MKRLSITVHIAALIIVTVLCGLIYATVQQTYRSGANDPQLQIAQDIKNAIEAKRSPQGWSTRDTIEISHSLGIFITLLNQEGQAIQSTGLLDGTMPQLPRGVLDFTKRNAGDVVTWQPRRGVRMALVVELVNSPHVGFVAVGRSLAEVEKRESNLTTMVFIAWIICCGIILLHWLVSFFTGKNQ